MALYTRPTPGNPLIPSDQISLGGFIRNLNHIPIGIKAPPGPAPLSAMPTAGPIWNKLVDFPSSQSISHNKAPRQR